MLIISLTLSSVSGHSQGYFISEFAYYTQMFLNHVRHGLLSFEDLLFMKLCSITNNVENRNEKNMLCNLYFAMSLLAERIFYSKLYCSFLGLRGGGSLLFQKGIIHVRPLHIATRILQSVSLAPCRH